nr:hypothetical protein BaRGS_000570 [Batillaria attramentaria]
MDGHGHGHPRRPGGRLLRPVSMEEAENSVNEIHESLPRRAAVRLYRQISSGFNSRTIRCILVVSLCLNLIFAVLIGIFVGFWQSSREFESARGGSKVFAPDYLAWKTKDESGTSFISDDLRYVNGTITIPAAARYHMYSHLTFDTIMNQIPKQLVVDHSILRISRGAQQQLVLDRVTLTQNKIKSSDLEGTFELRQGDIIKVMVSYPSYLYNVPQTNAMGLFKLVFG